jgi:hypothetical protein
MSQRHPVFEESGGGSLGCMEEERLEGIALILHAIDVTIAEVEARDDDDSRDRLETLRNLRERWRGKAQEEDRS